jgi:hypothetical protein
LDLKTLVLEDGGFSGKRLRNTLKHDAAIGTIADGAHELVGIHMIEALSHHLRVVLEVGSTRRGLDLLGSAPRSRSPSVRHRMQREERDDVGADFAISHRSR